MKTTSTTITIHIILALDFITFLCKNPVLFNSIIIGPKMNLFILFNCTSSDKGNKNVCHQWSTRPDPQSSQ